jgi:hypothetical protein
MERAVWADLRTVRSPSDLAAIDGISPTKRNLAVALSSVNLQQTDPKQALGRSIAGKGREPIGGVGAV